jgi:hypothetical protein
VLYKHARKKHLGLRMMRRWHSRFFVLGHGRLSWYADEKAWRRARELEQPFAHHHIFASTRCGFNTGTSSGSSGSSGSSNSRANSHTHTPSTGRNTHHTTDAQMKQNTTQAEAVPGGECTVLCRQNAVVSTDIGIKPTQQTIPFHQYNHTPYQYNTWLAVI